VTVENAIDQPPSFYWSSFCISILIVTDGNYIRVGTNANKEKVRVDPLMNYSTAKGTEETQSDAKALAMLCAFMAFFAVAKPCPNWYIVTLQTKYTT
jgi:hypothetical protein